MALEYTRADKIFSDVVKMIHDATHLHIKPDERVTNGAFRNGLYHCHNDRIIVGTKPLYIGMLSGYVSYVDCLSMCKQVLHEYRHFQQKQMFMGQHHDSAEHNLLNMLFGDDEMCRIMARQSLIAAEFPAYHKANQFNMSHERDAEEYAIRAVPDVLKSAGFPEELIGPCLTQEINRRFDWYGDRPVKSPLEAADDLCINKQGPPSAKLPLAYEKISRDGVSNTFLNDEAAQTAYDKLDCIKGDRFLVDYIARRDPQAFNVYKIIRDEMPELSAFEKLQRRMYRAAHEVPDDNAYEGPDC